MSATINYGPWSAAELKAFDDAIVRYGRDVKRVTAHVGTRTDAAIGNRIYKVAPASRPLPAKYIKLRAAAKKAGLVDSDDDGGYGKPLVYHLTSDSRKRLWASARPPTTVSFVSAAAAIAANRAAVADGVKKHPDDSDDSSSDDGDNEDSDYNDKRSGKMAVAKKKVADDGGDSDFIDSSDDDDDYKDDDAGYGGGDGGAEGGGEEDELPAKPPPPKRRRAIHPPAAPKRRRTHEQLEVFLSNQERFLQQFAALAQTVVARLPHFPPPQMQPQPPPAEAAVAAASIKALEDRLANLETELQKTREEMVHVSRASDIYAANFTTATAAPTAATTTTTATTTTKKTRLKMEK